jgi:hypothetical protein
VKKLYAAFYFQDDMGDVRFAELNINPKSRTIEFHVNGESVPVDPRRILIAEDAR